MQCMSWSWDVHTTPPPSACDLQYVTYYNSMTHAAYYALDKLWCQSLLLDWVQAPLRHTQCMYILDIHTWYMSHTRYYESICSILRSCGLESGCSSATRMYVHTTHTHVIYVTYDDSKSSILRSCGIESRRRSARDHPIHDKPTWKSSYPTRKHKLRNALPASTLGWYYQQLT